MGGTQRAGPSAAALWSLIADHRAALEYDWQVRFGLDVSAVLTREISWARAWALTSRLLLDPDSHLFASVQGWAYVPGPATRAAVDHFEWWVNAQRRGNTTTFQARRPWEKGAKARPAAMPREVSAESRQRRAELNRRLGLSES